jgi:hypothetical protein
MKTRNLFSSPKLSAPVFVFLGIVIISFIFIPQIQAQTAPGDDDAHVLSTDLLKELGVFQGSKDLGKSQSFNRLKAKVEKRKNAMLKMFGHPDKFLRHAFSDDLRKQFPPQVQSMIEEKIQAEGLFKVIYEEDFVNEKSVIHYLLEEMNGHGKSFKLHFAGEIPNWKTDDHIMVKGHRLDENIVLGLDSGATASTTASASSSLVAGEQKTAVILANFQNKSMECSAASVNSLMFSTVNSYYKEVSFNHVSLAGNVLGPFTIPHNSTDSCSYSSWGSSLHNAALAAGIDLSAFTRLIYVFPNNSCSSTASGYGTVGGSPSKSWILGYCDRKEVYAHEFGHNLGMHHASTPTNEYGDYSDVMGYSWSAFFHQNAPHKVQMGWVPGGNVVDVSQSGTYTLNMLEQSSASTQALKISKPDTQEFYFLGFRAPFNRDAALTSTYAHKTNVHKFKGGSNKTYFLSGLGDGISFRDDLNGVSVTQVAHTATSSTVAVNFFAPVCGKANPLVTISPSSQSATPGKGLAYTLSITNKHSSSCAAAMFALSNVSLPGGFSGSFTPSTISLASGAVGTVQWVVNSSASSAVGSYAISAKAVDMSDTTKTASVSGTYVVFVDFEPPVVSIIKPANMVKVKGNISVEASASDNKGVGKVEFYVDGKLSSTDASAPYSFFLNGNKLSTGQHAVMALGYDVAGNTASSSITIVK